MKLHHPRTVSRSAVPEAIPMIFCSVSSPFPFVSHSYVPEVTSTGVCSESSSSLSCPPVPEPKSSGVYGETASSPYVSCPQEAASIGVCSVSSTSPYVSCLSVPQPTSTVIYSVSSKFSYVSFPSTPKPTSTGVCSVSPPSPNISPLFIPEPASAGVCSESLSSPYIPIPSISEETKFVAYLHHPQMFLAHLKESRRKSAQQRKTKKTWTSQSSRISKLHIVPAVKHRLTIKVLFLLHHINICNHRSHPENIMHARTNNLIPSGLM